MDSSEALDQGLKCTANAKCDNYDCKNPNVLSTYLKGRYYYLLQNKQNAIMHQPPCETIAALPDLSVNLGSSNRDK